MPASNVRWGAPLTRMNPWFPGQAGGVPGTSNDTGLRLDSNARVVYVDPNFVGVSDGRDGTDPNEPLQTVTTALTKCRAYCNDTIIVAANSDWTYGDTDVGRAVEINEEVIVTVPGVRIVGLAPPSALGVYWKPVTASGVCITVHAMDVLIEGFCFWEDVLATPIGILSEWDGDTMWGDNLTVRNCCFETGLAYGIQLDFAYNCDIHHNYFEGISVAAIHSLDVEGDPDYAVIHNNIFNGCTAAIDLEDSGDCTIFENYIYGTAGGTNNFIDLTGGGRNMVANNFLACTIAQYDTTCSDATSGAWLYNHCTDGSPVAPPT